MKLIAVYLSPKEIDDDISLHVFQVEDFDTDIIRKELNSLLYEIDQDTFHYYEPGAASNGNGQFETVEDDGTRFLWLFETRELF
mgnify:CR=1 FL=1